MLTRPDPNRTDFQFTPTGTAPPRPQASPDASNSASGEGGFHILILSDLTGRASRNLHDPSLASRRPLKVDIDSLDSLIAKLNVQIHLPLGPASLPITIRQLDDFHPDRLFQQLPIFTKLRDLHARLANPATFPAAAAEVRSLFTQPSSGSAPPPSSPSPAPSPQPAPENTFASLLGRVPSAPAPTPTANSADAFIRSLIAPYGVAAPDPDQAHLQQLVADALAAGMRVILHHPAFQALEAAWRSVHFLVSRLNTDSQLRIFLLDITREELAANLSSPALEKSALYNILIDSTINTPGGIPWSLLIGNYSFGEPCDAAEIKLLATIATLAQAAGAPFIAGAAPALQRDLPAPLADFWAKLRSLPQATSLALTAPRFLLRQPYGPHSDPTDLYNFTEIPIPPSENTASANDLPHAAHESFLWGNSAFAAAYLIANAFLDSEEPAPGSPWPVAPTDTLEVPDLPAFILEPDADASLPCAEVYLTDSAAEALLARGLLPVLSIKHRPAIRLLGLPSISANNAPLQGRWS